MRIIAKKTLLEYAAKHPTTRASITHWIEVVDAATWTSTQDSLADFRKAKVLNAERVRFEIAGGDHRLIVAFYFRRSIAWIKFLGTHAQYDRVDALTVDEF